MYVPLKVFVSTSLVLVSYVASQQQSQSLTWQPSFLPIDILLCDPSLGIYTRLEGQKQTWFGEYTTDMVISGMTEEPLIRNSIGLGLQVGQTRKASADQVRG